jgi:glycine hydroxymethyltransferase
MAASDTADGGTRSRVAPWASAQAQARLREVEARVAGLLGTGQPDAGQADAVLAAARAAVDAHRARFDERGIVLYAGTNAMSPPALAVYHALLATRPSMGWPGEKFHAGLEDFDTLEVLAPLLVADLMGGRFAEVRLQSATLANLAVYGALTAPGDTIAVLPEAAGGHTSHHSQGVPALRGLRVVDLPYAADAVDLDYQALPGFLRRERPRLVVIGGSLMLFPFDVAAVRAALDEVDAGGPPTLLVYDASHVAGLVAAGRFQRPLDEGADVLTFSTYKSFGGPPGGCVVTRREDLARAVSTTAFPGMLANYDIARLAPLAVTAAELKTSGQSYVDTCLANATTLAHALSAEGFTVVGRHRGFTASHHVAVDAAEFGGGDQAARALAGAGIYLSGIGLARQRPDEPMRGLRIGTQEVTRRGLDEGAMRRVAHLMRRVLRDGEPPAAVLPDAVALRTAA